MRLRWLVLLFLVLPIVDAALLLWLVSVVGAGWVVTFVVVSAIAGVLLASRQASGAWRRWREAFDAQRAPEEGALGGVLALFGGLFLVVPGVLSDLLGVALLVPPVRRLVAERMRFAFEERLARGQIRVTTVQVGPSGAVYTERGNGPARVVSVPTRGGAMGAVIDTEGETVEEPKALPENGTTS